MSDKWYNTNWIKILLIAVALSIGRVLRGKNNNNKFETITFILLFIAGIAILIFLLILLKKLSIYIYNHFNPNKEYQIDSPSDPYFGVKGFLFLFAMEELLQLFFPFFENTFDIDDFLNDGETTQSLIGQYIDYPISLASFFLGYLLFNNDKRAVHFFFVSRYIAFFVVSINFILTDLWNLIGGNSYSRSFKNISWDLVLDILVIFIIMAIEFLFFRFSKRVKANYSSNIQFRGFEPIVADFDINGNKISEKTFKESFNYLKDSFFQKSLIKENLTNNKDNLHSNKQDSVENPSIERKENLIGLNSDQTIVDSNSNRTISVGEAINSQKTTLVKNENENPNIVSNPITSTTVIQQYMEESNRLRDGNTNSLESNKPSIDFAVLFHKFMEGLKKNASLLADTLSKMYDQIKVRETLGKWKKGIIFSCVIFVLIITALLSFGTIRNLYYEHKLGDSSEEEGKKAMEYFLAQGTEAYPRMYEILNSNSDPTKSLNALHVLEQLDASVEIQGSVLLNLLKSDESELQSAVLKFLSRNPSDQQEIADKILELIQSSKDEIKIDGLIAYSKISTSLTIQKNPNFDYYFQCASDLTSKARSACLKLVNLHSFNIDKVEQLNRLNMDSIGEGDIDTNKEALNYITSQFREKNEFLNWSKKNKIKYFSNIINSAIRKGNKELDKKLLTMVNQNTNMYNDKTIEIFSLLERVNEEDQAKNIIDSITQDNVKNSMLYSFSLKTNRQFSNEYKSVIKNFINSDNKSFINWIKQSGNNPATFQLGIAIDLIYDLNENNKEYHDLALYLKKSKAVSSLDQEHLNTLEDIINSYNENQNSSLSTDSMDEDSNYSNSSSVVKVDRSKIEQIPLKKTVTIDFAKFRSGPGKSFRAYDMTLFFKDQGTFRNVDFLPLGRQILITGRSEFQETISGSTDYWYYSSITLDQQEKSESKAGWIFGSLIEK